MADITLNRTLLERLAIRTNFPVPEDELVFFGIRGALPFDISGTPFAAEHRLRTADINNVQMRCTLGQFRPADGTLALFPGSTVPSMNNIRRARANAGIGANMLMLGCYKYVRGVHKPGARSGHRAFRQAEFFPVWRSRDDLDYDLNDIADLDGDLVFDNLHCAYHDNLDTPGFSSAGCQVVCGHPKSPSRGDRPEAGPWKRFIENAYDAATPQPRYTYMLFSAAEVLMVASRDDSQLTQSVRFGSQGDLVRTVQQALIDQQIPLDPPDGDFGRFTIEAVMAFQTREFGAGSADGIVGPHTAQALGITLPKLSQAIGAPEPGATPRVSIEHVESLAVSLQAPHDIRVEERSNGWFATSDGGTPFYVGSSVKWSGYQGIYQPAGRLGELPLGTYDPGHWADRLGDLGPWAWFIAPTIAGESSGYYARVNTYDGAGLTFGPMQFASHTPGDNLILLFRTLLALPGAERWFPDLTLVQGKVHRITSSGPVSLERTGASGRLDDFMDYLNPSPTSVSAREVESAARLIAWMVADEKVIEAQLAQTIKRFGERVARLGSAYGVDLAAQPIHLLVWVADILHHGRAGSGGYGKLRDAIQSAKPEAALAAIGASDPRWKERVAVVKAQIARIKPKLAGEVWGQGAFKV